MPENFQERHIESYKNLSERFERHSEDYNQQYHRIYMVRLKEMTQRLTSIIEKKWKNEFPLCKLHRLSEESYEKCVVIGTLFKHMKLKPSVLKELSESSGLIPQPIVEHFTDDSDTLYIEDELQRFELVFLNELDKEFNVKLLITGVVCGLLGRYDDLKGKFEVMDYVFYGFSGKETKIEKPIFNNDTYLIFMSGLDFINVQKSVLKLKLFSDFVKGFYGCFNGVNPSKIIRIIIAGGSIQKTNPQLLKNLNNFNKSTNTSTTNTFKSVLLTESIKSLDLFLSDLTQTIEIDLMPGQNDPSNFVLPQKPLHHCLFPEAIQFKSFNRVSNPYEFELANVRLLGTSGEPIKNVLNYTDIEDPLKAIESCLKWGHLAPSAPDTLGCFPYYDKDPFIIGDVPDVIFAGNQNEFATKIIKDGEKCVRIISVPDFSTTSSVCLLNLKNFECFEILFP